MLADEQQSVYSLTYPVGFSLEPQFLRSLCFWLCKRLRTSLPLSSLPFETNPYLTSKLSFSQLAAFPSLCVYTANSPSVVTETEEHGEASQRAPKALQSRDRALLLTRIKVKISIRYEGYH